MLGSLNSADKSVTIVGAGISGLLSAYTLDRAGYEVTLIDAADRAGGLIRTIETPYGMVECAANSLIATPPVEALCEDLQVSMRSVLDKGRARYIWRNGKMRRMPLSLGELIGTASRVLWTKGQGAQADRSLEDWGLHHLGPAGVQFLLTPFLLGVYGARPSELAVQAAFPFLEVGSDETLFQVLRKRKAARGKVAKAEMRAPRDGMGALIDALVERLDSRLGSRFQLGTEVKELPDAKNVWLSTPAGVSAKLVAGHDPAAAEQLDRVRYAPLVSATVFVTLRQLAAFRHGTGVLIPPSENRACLGVLFPSSTFGHRVSEARFSSFTMMLGGTVNPGILEQSDDELRETILEELTVLVGLTGDPLHIEICRWPRAIPVYSPGLVEVWKNLREGWCREPGRVLMGNYTGDVSIRGMIETLSSL